MIVTMLVLGWTASGANSQQLNPQQQAWLNSDLPAVKNAIEEIRRTYRPLLPKDQQDLMDSIVVSIRPADWNIFDIYAIAPPYVAKRTIVLSAGGLFIYDLAGQALADASNLGDMAAYGDYLTDLTSRIQAVATSSAGGQAFPVLPSYCEYRKHTEAECAALRARQDHKFGLELTRSGMMGLIFGHELGHHVFHHDAQPERPTIEKEAEADDFALKLMLRSDLSPAQAYGVFLMFAALEGAPPDKPQDRTMHPYALCRFSKAFKLAYSEFLKDPGYIEFLKQRGTLQQDQAEASQTIAFLDRVQCN